MLVRILGSLDSVLMETTSAVFPVSSAPAIVLTTSSAIAIVSFYAAEVSSVVTPSVVASASIVRVIWSLFVGTTFLADLTA